MRVQAADRHFPCLQCSQRKSFVHFEARCPLWVDWLTVRTDKILKGQGLASQTGLCQLPGQLFAPPCSLICYSHRIVLYDWSVLFNYDKKIGLYDCGFHT